jgi:hypothetical protein
VNERTKARGAAHVNHDASMTRVTDSAPHDDNDDDANSNAF